MNNLAGLLCNLLHTVAGCSQNSLEILRLNDNLLTGSLPVITRLATLTELNLSDNQLEGFSLDVFRQGSQLAVLKLGRSIGQMSSLKLLEISSNILDGVISESHLLKLSQLSQLDLSFNTLIVNFSSNWIPPFQLDRLKLASCKLGPRFPVWLRRQTKFSYLDISNSNISDVIPSWFWSWPSNLRFLNLSFNSISGKVPNLPNFVEAIDLSSNLFHGSMPPLPLKAIALNLSKNKFQGTLSLLCAVNDSALIYLDLSNNLFSGSLPDYWMNLKYLYVLNLENNDLSGIIPSSIGSLAQLQSLHIRNNSFSGELSPSLRICTQLVLLDLLENKLSRKIPAWMGKYLTGLSVLRLKSNEFYGNIPPSLCHLEYLQVLDLSLNNVLGGIPSCLNNLTGMAQRGSSNLWIDLYYNFSFDRNDDFVVKAGADYASIVWKGVEQEFGKTLNQLKIIDLSSNKLTGEIPGEVTSLGGLIALNLSRNMLTGSIPGEIGKLIMLESLDLSTNHLSATIPESLADLSFISMLELSNNNLSGKIPSSTQLQSLDAASYVGNPELLEPHWRTALRIKH